ncbi:FAD/NAD-binding domain-containing protein [Amylostereum chailletii]|nr:FAD/NAD-binding domain-containing protein [Amylostereum chailletii]
MERQPSIQLHPAIGTSCTSDSTSAERHGGSSHCQSLMPGRGPSSESSHSLLKRLASLWTRRDRKKNQEPDADERKAADAYRLGDFCIDEDRPMKVVCIGAGFSGIIAGIRFAQKVRNIDLKIYEKQAGIGGTWRANAYPGVSCDIPSHNLTFENNTEWKDFYASGADILANLERIVEKYKLMKYIRLQHELVNAHWDDASHKWRLLIRRGEENEEFEDTADVLFLGVGSLSRWRWPDIEGLDVFGGQAVHSAEWCGTRGREGEKGSWQESVKEWGEKRVGVIGNGSSGIQIVTALHPHVRSLTNFVRSPQWMSASWGVDAIRRALGTDEANTGYEFTNEHRERFEDPESYREFRRGVEAVLNRSNEIIFRDSDLQKQVAAEYRSEMTRKTEQVPGLADKVIPKWAVSCRRLTPGAGYLEALSEGKVNLETTAIKRVTPTGVELEDGRHELLDVIVCATGFDTTYHYPFDVVGRDGLRLEDRWQPHPEAYLSVAIDGFPNMFFAYGPNSGVNSGTLLILLEKQVEYAVQVTLKLQRERLGSIEVKKEVMRNWSEYMKTVFTDSCHSWYRSSDGVVVGIWPGTNLHAVRALAHPRWEDYNYTPLDQSGNALYWLGDGRTYNEKTLKGDLAWYLDESVIDRPPVPLN